MAREIILKYFMISGLQMTDVELDARVTALEENGGGGAQNGTCLSAYFGRYLTFCKFQQIYRNKKNKKTLLMKTN